MSTVVVAQPGPGPAPPAPTVDEPAPSSEVAREPSAAAPADITAAAADTRSAPDQDKAKPESELPAAPAAEPPQPAKPGPEQQKQQLAAAVVTPMTTDQPATSAPPAPQQSADSATATAPTAPVRNVRPHPAVKALAPPAYVPKDPQAVDRLDVSTSFALAAAQGMAEAQHGDGTAGRKRRDRQMPAKYREDMIDGKKVDSVHRQEARSIKRAKTRCVGLDGARSGFLVAVCPLRSDTNLVS